MAANKEAKETVFELSFLDVIIPLAKTKSVIAAPLKVGVSTAKPKILLTNKLQES
ncbi:hypothetical protein D3C85_1851350 [compost metagenome]